MVLKHFCDILIEAIKDAVFQELFLGINICASIFY